MSIQRVSGWKYDVFLSFRGADTRRNFTDHLYTALNDRGIRVFRDDNELERGKFISPGLLQAIEESKFSVVVFSRNYASSTWCLDELVKVVECMETRGQTVMPVFYDVDPSVVRKQSEVFQKAFVKHEETLKKNIVEEWRTALTKVANLSGWDLKDRHESEFIKDIVKEISSNLSLTKSTIVEGLVGINPCLEKLMLLIHSECNDVRMIGICGMGGIGKTTIARVVYELISYEFEGQSFLANVREILETSEGRVSLQKQLLSETLMQKDIDIYNIYDGISMIKSRLRCKKVLIVIDDVTHEEQLNMLAGRHDWFGLGSRIIITSRDKHLLKSHRIDEVYNVEGLNYDDALQLFNMKAFNGDPSYDYMVLSRQVVHSAGGLPLALKVWGSFLFGRNIDEWKDALKRLKQDSKKDILDRLQAGFDGLEERYQNIFLDIACFFKGENKDYVTQILDGCGFNATSGIGVLIDKSLITILDNNRLWMHDLLQEMGKQIVKREFPKEPGKRSRLWEEADICHVLTRNLGTELVESIILNFPEEEVHCNAKAFLKMINLRLLKIRKVQLPGGLEYLSNELRLLDWNEYPLKSLPSNFKPDKLVKLNLNGSCIQQLWKGTKLFNTLTSINFKDSQYLRSTPDFTGVPNLKKVSFEGCKKLHQIHPSLLVHKNITLLDMTFCTSLTTLPENIHMESLKGLLLSFCSKLKKFPNIMGSMDCLSELALDKTAIKKLPLSIELLTRLHSLNLSDCKHLITLPSTINGLKSLEFLNLSGCSKLENLPETFGQLETLWVLELSGTAIRQPMSSIFLMKKLNELDFRGCKGLPSKSSSSRFLINLMQRRESDSMAFRLPSLSGSCTSLTRLILNDCNLEEESVPSDFFGSFSSLWHLELRKNNFVSLPVSISRLSKLQYLYLDGCKRLHSLSELPSNIRFVNVDGCSSLETLSNALWLCSSELSTISCLNCIKLIGYNRKAFSMLKKHLNKVVPKLRDIVDIYKRQRQIQVMDAFSLVVPGSKIPKWLSHQCEGHSIRIEKPPYLNNNSKLVGYVVCSIFAIHNHPPVRRSSYHRGTHWVSCIANVNFYSGPNPIIRFEEEISEDESDHLWLLYFPCHNHNFNKYYRIGRKHVGFSFTWGGPGLEMKRCGVRTIYEQDVKEFNKIMNQS